MGPEPTPQRICRRPVHEPDRARGSTATAHQDILEVHARLGQLRSFIRWTAPLYALFLVAGLYATDFVLESSSILMLALLAAFGALDIAVLTTIHRIEAAPIHSDFDLLATNEKITRLSRTVFFTSLGLGIAFLVAFVAIVFAS